MVLAVEDGQVEHVDEFFQPLLTIMLPRPSQVLTVVEEEDPTPRTASYPAGLRQVRPQLEKLVRSSWTATISPCKMDWLFSLNDSAILANRFVQSWPFRVKILVRTRGLHAPAPGSRRIDL